MMPSTPMAISTTARHREGAVLLSLGMLAGPLYLVVGLVQVLTREGFDVRQHALSLLSNGAFGWIQVANFILTGGLIIIGAIGCRRAIRAQSAGTWGPILLFAFGVGLIGSGLFRADPAHGFPPGSITSETLSTSAALHFVFGGIGFYALIAACFVFMRRFLRYGQTELAWYSAITGAGFFASFALIASGSTAPAIMLAFYAAVAWILVWHTIVLLQISRRTSFD